MFPVLEPVSSSQLQASPSLAPHMMASASSRTATGFTSGRASPSPCRGERGNPAGSMHRCSRLALPVEASSSMAGVVGIILGEPEGDR